MDARKNYRAVVVFDDQSILRMFRAEYYTYERTCLLAHLCIAAVMIMTALVEGLPLAAKAVCMRMVEDKTCFYIFKNRQSAIMVPKMVLQPDHPKEFQNFIEHKTQKKWHSMAGLLFMKGEDANAFKLPLLQFGAKSQYRD